MVDTEWLNALKGKTRDIALAIYQNNLSDDEIAAKYASTVQYVQKIKSTMRTHSFVIPKHQFKERARGIEPSEGVKTTVRQAERLSMERLSREDLKSIYADFKQGIGLEIIAIKHGLFPDTLIQLWRGWQAITGRGNIVRLCDIYGRQGIIEFHEIGQYLAVHGLRPRKLVSLLDSIGNLQAYDSELQSTIVSLEEQRSAIGQDVEALRHEKDQTTTELDQKQKHLATIKQELIATEARVLELRESESQIRQSVDELLSARREYVRGIAAEVAKSVLVNDQALREKAVNDILNEIANSPLTALAILESIAKGVKPNISVEEFMQKYEPLVEEARKRVHESFEAELFEKVSQNSNIPIQRKNL